MANAISGRQGQRYCQDLNSQIEFLRGGPEAFFVLIESFYGAQCGPYMAGSARPTLFYNTYGGGGGGWGEGVGAC
jgi:hypothetical protein